MPNKTWPNGCSVLLAPFDSSTTQHRSSITYSSGTGPLLGRPQAYATSATNPEEVKRNATHYILSDHIQQLEKVCLCIIGTMCFCHHRSQLSHGVCEQPKNPCTCIQLILPQEWRLFIAIPPFKFSTLFLFLFPLLLSELLFLLGT